MTSESSNCGFCSANIMFILAAMMMLMLASSAAQQGQNAVMDSGNHPQSSPSFLDATQFSSGLDPCQAIALTFTHLPTTGGTVDAQRDSPERVQR